MSKELLKFVFHKVLPNMQFLHFRHFWVIFMLECQLFLVLKGAFC